MAIDSHCDGTCSTLDGIGIRIVSHEEIEADLDKSLKYLDRTVEQEERKNRYQQFMSNIQQKHPTTYKILNKINEWYKR
jgi:hypothetical protein